MVGTVVKTKVGDLEEEIREGFPRRLRKDMNGVVQEVFGERRFLVRFQDGLEKEILSNRLTILAVRSELEEEIKVREVEMIPEVREEFGCYHWVYISLNLIKDDGLDKREDKVCVDMDADEEETEDVVLDDEKERHWRIGLEDNNVGLDGTKALLHDKK